MGKRASRLVPGNARLTRRGSTPEMSAGACAANGSRPRPARSSSGHRLRENAPLAY